MRPELPATGGCIDNDIRRSVKPESEIILEGVEAVLAAGCVGQRADSLDDEQKTQIIKFLVQRIDVFTA